APPYIPSSLPLFFFQAEDGIRDSHVTGVQTCALPISSVPPTGNLWPAFASSTVRHERTLTSGSASGALSIGIDGSVGPSANVEVTVIDTDENTNPNTKQQLQNRVTIATDRGVVQELNLE